MFVGAFVIVIHIYMQSKFTPHSKFVLVPLITAAVSGKWELQFVCVSKRIMIEIEILNCMNKKTKRGEAHNFIN